MKKKLIALCLASATLATCLAGCGAPASTGDTSGAVADDSTLIIAIPDEVEGCDIQQIGWENVVQSLIYEPLVEYNEDMTELLPAFAEDYEVSEDGLTITFTLPADAKFSNGDTLDAAAVKASVERFMEVSEYSTDLEAVESVEAVDETTLVYHLSAPAPYMWASLASTYGGIVDVAAAEEMGDEAFNRTPVGNGRYYVENWEQGSQITLKRNENYVSNNPEVSNTTAFETVIVRFIPDEFTRVSELQHGNVDIIYNVPSASIGELEADENVTTYRYLQTGVNYMNLQTEKGPTADPAVRQAMTYAIDRDEINLALENVVTPAYTFLSPAQTGYSKAKEDEFAQTYAYNPEKAAQILADAGYVDTDGDGIVEKDGQPLTVTMMVASDRPSMSAAAPVIQQQMKAVGIDLQISEYEAAYVKQATKDDDYEISTRNYEWSDADILYSVFTSASGYPWNDDTVTADLEYARTVNDPEARVEAYEKFSDDMAQLYKGIPLFSDNYCIAAKSSIQGLVVTNDGRSWYHDVTRAQ